MQSKIPVGHTAYAAALAISGAPVSVERIRCLASDKERTLWHVGSRGGPGHETWNIASLHAAMRSGDIWQEPLRWHPCADALRAIDARSQLLQWRSTGNACYLVLGDNDAEHARYRLVPGWPTILATPEVIVRGVATAAALCCLGGEVVGPGPHRTWRFNMRGMGPEGPWMVGEFLGRLAAGKVEDVHPWWGLFYGAENMERMVETAKSAAPLIELAAMTGTRRATIPENAGGGLMDVVRRWLTN
jgi:hypothetical protein